MAQHTTLHLDNKHPLGTRWVRDTLSLESRAISFLLCLGNDLFDSLFSPLHRIFSLPPSPRTLTLSRLTTRIHQSYHTHHLLFIANRPGPDIDDLSANDPVGTDVSTNPTSSQRIRERWDEIGINSFVNSDSSFQVIIGRGVFPWGDFLTQLNKLIQILMQIITITPTSDYEIAKQPSSSIHYTRRMSNIYSLL